VPSAAPSDDEGEKLVVANAEVSVTTVAVALIPLVKDDASPIRV
jgi:hypothetical protein